MTIHEARLRVRYAETDQMGIVYHANYLVWMEVGRVEFFRARGLRYRDFETEAGLKLAVVEAGCRYHSPARYDDEIAVRTQVTETNARMVVFGYEIVNAATGQTLATGHTKHVFLDSEGKPRKVPEAYRPAFAADSES
ncbi:MAG: thioesterase family protein [Bryobacteraceae bacterium]